MSTDGFKAIIIEAAKAELGYEPLQDSTLEYQRLQQFVEQYGLQTAVVDYDISVGSDGVLPDERIIRDNVPFSEATGISSRITSGPKSLRFNGEPRTEDQMLHLPVLDIDLDAVLVSSSTPGHHHLIINKPMNKQQYLGLLDALARFGIVQPGYAGAAHRRKGSWIRTPGTEK